MPPEVGDSAVDPVTEIHPEHGFPTLALGELWNARHLFQFLVARNIKVRYAQTVLGIAWVILQPLATMAIFAAVFGGLAGIPSDGAPYPAFVMVALVAWLFFAGAVGGATSSLVEQANIIGKVYFPRLFVPFAPVAASLVDAGIAITLTVIACAFLGLVPSVARLLVLPPLFLIAAGAAAGVGAGLSALNLRYRDFRYVVPFVLQGWMFASPVVYSASLVPENYRLLYALNPMVGVIEGCRWAILGTPAPGAAMVGLSAASAAVLLFTGVVYFRWAERTMVDVA